MSSLLERELRHGFVVAVHTDEVTGDDVLMEEERIVARDFTDARRRTFSAGRIALRRALAACGLPVLPVLRDARGAPKTSASSVSMSISHKDDVAVALVSRADSATKVGVDVEIARPIRFDIARRVLTDVELEAHARLPEVDKSAFVLRRFSTKEAIYKAIDPFVQRYVGFREVSLIDSMGAQLVELHFEPPLPLLVEVAQLEIDLERVGRIILSTATASPKSVTRDVVT